MTLLDRNNFLLIMPLLIVISLRHLWPLARAGRATAGPKFNSRARSKLGERLATVGLLVLVLVNQATSANPLLTTVHNFTGQDGAAPLAGLIQTQDGSLYGTTSAGGASVSTNSKAGYGTIFKMTTDGALTTLYSFNALDGIGPAAELLDGGDGYFYGTTAFGGPDFNGDPDT